MSFNKKNSIFRRLRITTHLIFRRFRIPNSHFLDLLAIFVGIVSALVAFLFLESIELIRFGVSQLHSLVNESLFLVLIPSMGGLLCGLTIFLFSANAQGQGIPYVIYAVLVKSGLLDLKNSICRMLATIFTLGTMGSAGTEGPVVYFGSAVGSGFGQSLKLSPHNMKIMVGCGAAAGIAATFQAPIGGVLFALEAILHSFSPSIFSPIIIASVVSAVTFKTIAGDHNNYLADLVYEQQAWEVFGFVIVGVICGLVAVGFVKLLSRFNTWFNSISIHPVLRPALGGFLTGCILLKIPEVEGNSYELVVNLVSGNSLIWQSLLLFLLLKILATCFTLGSGGFGGIFAPSLVFGAIIGAITHMVLSVFFPQISSAGIYVMVGMASFVSGTTHGPFAAILILCEMTGNYTVILPLLAGCVSSIVVARSIYELSAYSAPLVNLGIHLRDGHDLDVLKTYKVRDLMEENILSVNHDLQVREVLKILHNSPHDHVLVRNEEDMIEGVISYYYLTPFLLNQTDGLSKTARETMHITKNFVYATDAVIVAYDLFLIKESSYLLVRDEHDCFLGIVFKADIMRSYRKALHQKSLAMTH